MGGFFIPLLVFLAVIAVVAFAVMMCVMAAFASGGDDKATGMPQKNVKSAGYGGQEKSVPTVSNAQSNNQ
ncbi:MAG: hypothetical protein LUI15_02680 [Firmicutes bacterium]|nr:hypothetical protein [Bacillota bacterium]